MATNILLKSSVVASKIPTTAQLSLRELAVNTVDGKLFLRQGTGIAGDNIYTVNPWNQSTGGASYNLSFTAGNVGIGTTPSYKLDVFGSGSFRPASTQDGLIVSGRAGGTSSYSVTITPTTLNANRTLTVPDITGTIITTGDTGTVTNTMLAGSIANAKLANSTISGVALGSNLNTLTLNVSGTGLSGSTTYNGSAAATFTVTSNATNANTASTIVARDASGNFSAGTITATLSGNASTATTATNLSGGSVSATTGSFSGQITSTLASGTAPLSITSTTTIPNLSAERISDVTGTGSALRITHPRGASYATGTATVTGAIKIKLPTATFKSNTMMRMTIKIYEYAGGASGTSRTIEVGGYNYSDAAANWYNYFAYQNTMGGSDINVRFGNDGTSQCIWIGETSTSWAYPQVFVTDFQAGYTSYTDALWGSGWAVSFTTAFDTVTQGPIVAGKNLNSQNYNSYAPTLTGGGASGTWGINVTGNAGTSTTLATTRTLWGQNFNGGANVTGDLTSVGNITGTNSISITSGGTNTNINLVPNGTGTVDVASKRITSVATPTQDTDAVNKSYVDAFITGLSVKNPVRAATTANLAATYNNGTSGVGATLTNAGTQVALSIDGVTLSVNDRVLVKDQNTSSQNGIYVVTNVGSASTNWILTRATDADNSIAGELFGGDFVFVQEGTNNADNGYVITTDGTITIGTTSITWVQFSGAGQINAGDGLTKTGNRLDVGGTANRITVNADNIDIASTYVGQTSITTVGTITTGTWSGSFGAVSGANLTSLTAGNLTGTIPSGVLGNSSLNIGTTSVALNRASANLALTGISSIALPGATSGTITLTPTATAGTTTITLPATTGTVVTTGDTGSVTSTMIADGTIVNADINASAAIAVSKLAASTISGITLGNNLNTLTLNVSGTGLSGSTTYNGSAVATFTVTSNATNANTASTIVARDASGNFSAGTITAALSGNASTATASTTQASSDNSTNIATTAYVKSLFGSNSTSGTLDWNDVTNTRPGVGPTLLLGNATNGPGGGNYYHPLNLEYSSKDGTGNVTQLAVAYGTPANEIYMRGRYNGTWTNWFRLLNSNNYNSYAPTLTGTGASGTWGINVTGNAGTATTLATTRTLWGQNFNGSANVTGDLTSVGNITGTGAVNLTATSATLGLVATGANVITASTNGSERLRIDSSGNVGIGTSSPQAKLEINDTGVASVVVPLVVANQDTSTSGTGAGVGFVVDGVNNVVGAQIEGLRTGSAYHQSALVLRTRDASGGGLLERLRIDSSGRVLVGTSSALSNVKVRTVAGTSQSLQIQGGSSNYNTGLLITNCEGNGYGSTIALGASRGNTATPLIVASSNYLGTVSFNGYDGANYIPAAEILGEVDGTPGTNDMPGRLVFSTTADGASSPTERLRIDSTGQVEINNLGSAASPALSWLSDTNTGIYSPGADQIALATGGTGRVFVDASGNFGVGTNSPNSKIHCFGGDIYLGSGSYTQNPDTASRQLRLYTNNNSSPIIKLGAAYSAVSANVSWFRTYVNAAVNGSLVFESGSGSILDGSNNEPATWTERLRIDSSGNVGIGTAGQSVASRLCIAGSSSDTWAASSSDGLAFNGNAAGISTITTYLDTSSLRLGAGTTQKTGILITGSTSGSGSTVQISAGGSERLRIDSSGNVGIGTSSPGARLDVNGNISLTGTFNYSGKINHYTTEGTATNGQNRTSAGLYSLGKKLYLDETFIYGTNGLAVYDNNSTGTVTITRVSSSGLNAPNNSGFVVRITHSGSAQSPGYGGFYFATQTRANATFACVFKAKLPTGYTIGFATNPIGSGGNNYWATDNVGTGKWEDYVYVVRCGDSGTFSSTNYFYITGSPAPSAGSPLTWYLSSATVYDVDDRDNINTGGYNPWHAGNDGAGSGLDADLLDGLNAATANTASTIVARDASGNFSAGTITATTFSGSGASLTNLPAGQLSGTIPSAVLGNSSVNIGTTSIALNRASANLALTGISSIALPGATSGTVTLQPAATAGATTITLPATTGTVVTTGDSGTVTGTMIANTTIAVGKLSATGTANSTTFLRGDNTWSTISTGITVSDDTTTNATRYLVFEDVTSGSSSAVNVSSTKLTFNPSTGNLVVGGTVTANSDISLKRNIKTIPNALNKVLSLRGVEFKFKKNNEKSIGVIAQEVEEVFPELVKDNQGVKSVAYQNMVGILIEAIKEQNSIILGLKSEIEEMKKWQS